MAGVAGYLLTCGVGHTISTSLVGGRGFTAIVVAWLAKLNPLAMTLVAFLLVPHLGFPGACLANPAAWLAADCFLIPCYFAVMRKIRSRVQEVPDIPLPI